MELRNKSGSFKASVEEILKLIEGIKTLFCKNENDKQKNKEDDIRLENFTPFSKDEFGIED